MTNPATSRRLSRKEIARQEWERICLAFGYCCAYCGRKPDQLHRDHSFPKVRGGDDSLENILPACGNCNCSKGARTPLEWFLDNLEPGIEPRKRKPKKWPLSEDPCRKCGGVCERRSIGGYGTWFYDKCKRCKFAERLDHRLPFTAQPARVGHSAELGQLGYQRVGSDET